MTKDEFMTKVKDYFKDLGIQEVSESSRFSEELEQDSLDMVELLMFLEEKTGIEILDEDAEKMKKVEDVISYLKQRCVITGES